MIQTLTIPNIINKRLGQLLEEHPSSIDIQLQDKTKIKEDKADEIKRENDMDVIYVSRAIIDDNRDIKIPIFTSKESKKYITNIA